MSENLLTLEKWLTKARKATYSNNPKAAESIASHTLRLNKIKLATNSEQIHLSQKNLLKMNNLLGRLLAGRSLAAVLGHTDFYNISLKINSKVLSPRAETEELVEYAIKNIPKNSKVFEIGTGSGAIGLSVAKARPDLSITVTDISHKTLNLAKLNARKNKINGVKFIKSSLFKNVDQKDLRGVYILANLPYVDPAWADIKHKYLKHEPHTALFAGAKGMQIITNLIDQTIAKKLLTTSNWILLEHDPRQYGALTNYCSKLNMDTQSISPFVSLAKLK